MALYAIGDIHGSSYQLQRLIDHFDFGSQDMVVALGDYVDRGPDSQGVISKLIQLQRKCQLIALRGNHEALMMESRTDLDTFINWNACGGLQTLKSYQSKDLTTIPSSHWEFIYNTTMYYEKDHYVFVHGGALPNIPLEDQGEETLLWQRFPMQKPLSDGRKVICGHTPQTQGLPVDVGHAICLDTHVYGSGWLTCLRLDDSTYVQAHATGEIRTRKLIEPPRGL